MPSELAKSDASTKTMDKVNGERKDGQAKSPLQLISQGVCLPGIPQFPSFGEQRQWMLEKMALSFRVFARKGFTAGLAGHISVRDPEWVHAFWTNPVAKHFALMKASDMILVNHDGKPIGGNVSSPANGAGFQIHSAIHQARPDVVAAAHAHSPFGLAWSPFGRPVEMLTQDAAYVYGDAQGVYDDFGGVVFDAVEAGRVGDALGTLLDEEKRVIDELNDAGPRGKALILRNHGLLTVGKTVDEACFLMDLMERCCHVQLLAEAAAANGVQKTFVSDAAAKHTFENSSTSETLYWEAQPDLEYEAAMSGGEHAK